MADTIIAEQVTVPEPAAAPAPAERPTREQLQGEGWSEREMDEAEKRGMVAKPGEPKKAEGEQGKEEGGAGGPAGDGPKGEGAAKEEPAPKPAAKAGRGSLPELDLTPEQEQKLTEILPAGTPLRAFYFRMKNERQARQATEAKLREANAKISVYEKAGPQPAPEKGPEIDPTKPLTLEALTELQKAQEKEQLEQRAKTEQRRQAVAAATKDQEEYAKSVYSDFDETVTRAQDLIKNLDAMVAEPWKRDKIVRLVRELQVAYQNADQNSVDGYNAAHIAYEIGQFHPEYGQPAAAKDEGGAGAGAAAKPKGPPPNKETLKRIEQNLSRRQSSASVGAGAGGRVVAAEDVTAEEFLRMDSPRREDFRKKHPAVYRRLMQS